MIGIVLGSPSDKKIADKGIAFLEELDIPHKLFILSMVSTFRVSISLDIFLFIPASTLPGPHSMNLLDFE